MPLDHYVPQVYLSKWSQNSQELLYAVRKTDLSSFRPMPKAVCAIRDGSNNQYLEDERKIEAFLKKIEPKIGASIKQLAADKFDEESIYTIAGLVASISICAPTFQRLQLPMLRSVIKDTARILERQGQLPKLDGFGLTELLESSEASIAIDGKYPQATGIENIERFTLLFTNCDWEIIHNEQWQSPFFTSDYPIGLERSKDYSLINNKIFPLSPDLAIRIKPSSALKEQRPAAHFERFSSKIVTSKRAEVECINRTLVRCAEELVFVKEDYPWVKSFINANRLYQIDSIPIPGQPKLFRQQIVKMDKPRVKPNMPQSGWFSIVPKES